MKSADRVTYMIKGEPHQNMMIDAVCLSMPSHLPFFLDMIKEIYDKDISSFYLSKKKMTIHMDSDIYS
jgi:hypothetical protein